MIGGNGPIQSGMHKYRQLPLHIFSVSDAYLTFSYGPAIQLNATRRGAFWSKGSMLTLRVSQGG